VRERQGRAIQGHQRLDSEKSASLTGLGVRRFIAALNCGEAALVSGRRLPMVQPTVQGIQSGNQLPHSKNRNPKWTFPQELSFLGATVRQPIRKNVCNYCPLSCVGDSSDSSVNRAAILRFRVKKIELRAF
jgi:hypothetical protein